MMERYLVVAARIRQELEELERVVARAERAIATLYIIIMRQGVNNENT